MAIVSKLRKLGLTVQIVALVSALLLAINIVLGYALANQSSTAMKTLIQQRMLDISNTAAAMLDGDELERLTADDVQTDAYQNSLETLKYFQDNIELEYIYCIEELADGSFAFTIDPAVVDPGEFGDPIVSTDALETAAKGTAAVDDKPYADEWGEFYSAYSPVFNSQGKVAGIVAVDFAADWFNEQVAAQTRIAVTVGLISLAVGALVALIIMDRYRQRFTKVYHELESLAGDMESLAAEVISSSGTQEVASLQPSDTIVPADDDSTSDIDAMSKKIRLMHATLKTHIGRIQIQAYSDALTGVGNKAAYVEKLKRLSAEIADDSASFIVAVFDINGLKEANDTYGHDEGDRLIIDVAGALTETFGRDYVFRVGGDEFIVIVEHITPDEMASCLATFEDIVRAKNQQPDREQLKISVSKGWCAYQPEEHEDYQSVFRHADEAMYDDKAAYYRTRDRRRRRY